MTNGNGRVCSDHTAVSAVVSSIHLLSNRMDHIGNRSSIRSRGGVGVRVFSFPLFYHSYWITTRGDLDRSVFRSRPRHLHQAMPLHCWPYWSCCSSFHLGDDAAYPSIITFNRSISTSVVIDRFRAHGYGLVGLSCMPYLVGAHGICQERPAHAFRNTFVRGGYHRYVVVDKYISIQWYKNVWTR